MRPRVFGSTAALFLVLFVLSYVPALAGENTILINNSADLAIEEVLIAVEGEEWQSVDIADGIPAGGSMEITVVVGEDGLACDQQVMAVFTDQSESEPMVVNLCKEGINLEF